MRSVNQYAPSEIRVWRVAGALRADIPRTVVRTPRVVDHRPRDPEQTIGHRELADLALNILNVLLPWHRDATGDLAPVKCFRGHCSAVAARYHVEFAREFLQVLSAEGGCLKTADIIGWIDNRKRMQTVLETVDEDEAIDIALSA
jgi:hypothetical protein